MIRHANQISPWVDTTYHDAGMTPAAVKRGEAQGRNAERKQRSERIRMTRAPRHVHPDREHPTPEALLQATVAKIEIQLRIGNLAAAHAHIDGFAQALAGDPPPATYDDFLAISVGDMGFPQRTLNLLDSIGIETMGDLLAGFPQRLVGVFSCGEETIKAIGQKLREWGALAAEESEKPVTPRPPFVLETPAEGM